MTQSIGLDANGDIHTANGNLVFVSSLSAVMQNCQTAMLAQRGEMMYATDTGMPTLQTAWNNYSPQQFEAAARAVITAVSGVVSVLAFSAKLTDGTLSYSATINTIYGVSSING